MQESHRCGTSSTGAQGRSRLKLDADFDADRSGHLIHRPPFRRRAAPCDASLFCRQQQLKRAGCTTCEIDAETHFSGSDKPHPLSFSRDIDGPRRLIDVDCAHTLAAEAKRAGRAGSGQRSRAWLVHQRRPAFVIRAATRVFAALRSSRRSSLDRFRADEAHASRVRCQLRLLPRPPT